jgi:heme O synthase-like polyprenyltransferase
MLIVSNKERISFSHLIKAYFELTKPGITRMIVLTAATGYYLAIPVHFEEYCSSMGNILLFLFTMVGTALTSAGSCVIKEIMINR